MHVPLVAQTVKRLPTMRETWVQSLDQEDLLEKEMATHSSILAWKIPWTEEPTATVHAHLLCCQKSARKRDLRMPGLDGCCAGLRASLPGGFPKPFRCHREESGNPGRLYFDRQNLGLGARALSLVSLNKHKYCLTPGHFLCPLYAIVYMQLPIRTPAPEQQRLASSARCWWHPPPWTQGGAVAPLFLKNSWAAPRFPDWALKILVLCTYMISFFLCFPTWKSVEGWQRPKIAHTENVCDFFN